MGALSKRCDLPMEVSGHGTLSLAVQHRLSNLFRDYGQSASPETTLDLLTATFACCGRPALRSFLQFGGVAFQGLLRPPTLNRRGLEFAGGARFVVPPCGLDIQKD